MKTLSNLPIGIAISLLAASCAKEPMQGPAALQLRAEEQAADYAHFFNTDKLMEEEGGMDYGIALRLDWKLEDQSDPLNKAVLSITQGGEEIQSAVVFRTTEAGPADILGRYDVDVAGTALARAIHDNPELFRFSVQAETLNGIVLPVDVVIEKYPLNN